MKKLLSVIARIGLCMVMAVVVVSEAGVSLIRAEEDSGSDTQVTQTEPVHLAVDPVDGEDGYSAVLYDNSNGLPTAESNAVAQTSDGCLWIGSYSGLIRYDGNKFERIDSTTGVVSVVSLFVDSDDKLWIGTNDNGVAVMEKDKFRLFGKVDGLCSASVRSITEDHDGNIYVATTSGINKIDSEYRVSLVDIPELNGVYVREIYTCNDGTLIGVTMNGDFFRIKESKLTGYYSGEEAGLQGIHTIYPDMNNPGRVYLGTDKSEFICADISNGLEIITHFELSALEYIDCIREYDDSIWICADNGIAVCKNGQIEHLDHMPMTRSVNYMMADFQGNLWFCSSRQGLMKIVANEFTDVFAYADAQAAVVNSTCFYDDKLFVGEDSGLQIISKGKLLDSFLIKDAKNAADGKVLDDTDLITMFDKIKIRSIVTDSKGRLWISTFSKLGLVMYYNGHVTVYGMDSGLPSERVRNVQEFSDGRLMIACTGGVAVMEDDKITRVIGGGDGITNLEILTVSEAPDGDILIGTDGGGLFVVNDSGTERLGTGDGLWSEVIMRIKKDRSEDISWIVTSNSLAYMDADDKIHTITGFPYSNNFDLYENEKGEMWILSSNGIYVIDKEELKKNEDLPLSFYSKENGVCCITTSNSYSGIDDRGNLYIAGTTGVCKVNIDTFSNTTAKMKMDVPYIEADSKRIYPDMSGNFYVPSDAKRVTIFAYIYSYSLEDPIVTYKLNGVDDEIVSLKKNELVPISYTNLAGGSYVFRLSVEGNPDMIKINIIKDKTIFERVWFKMLLVCLLIAVIVGIVMLVMHRRMKNLLKKEKENRTLIREIIAAFAYMIDMKDKYTNGHSVRVAKYTKMLAEELGYNEETVDKFYNIALLHDLGKISISADILNKPGKLTDEEFEKIKSHSEKGDRVLKHISIMPELATGARSHHERPDGKGYPDHLKGDEIPRVAQIIAVADTFDAMYSDRPYRKRMNFDKAVSIIKEVSGTQLTSDVVDAFLRLVDKGCFRAKDDKGGGTVEDIDNIHKRLNKEAQFEEAEKRRAENENKDENKG